MIPDELESLKGQTVEIIYNGILYRGTLVGVSEDEIFVQTPEQWISLPLQELTEIRKAAH
jgi:hypothetical protein